MIQAADRIPSGFFRHHGRVRLPREPRCRPPPKTSQRYHVPEGLTRRIAIVACARGVSTASIFAVNVILTRTWTQEEFGRFGSVWVLANTLVPVFLAGLPTGLLYFFPAATRTGRRCWCRRRRSACSPPG